MKTTCIVDNYNYEIFLVEAVESALNQTVPFDEVVIVDDGSTDRSQEVIRARWGGNERVRVVLKPNGGQMSAFNAGFAASTGELLCFLDSDDLYYPGYLEATLRFYQEHPECDFAYCAHEKFHAETGVVVDFPGWTDLGMTAVRVNSRKSYFGGATSTLSLRRGTAQRIMPYPYPEDWCSRADDVLNWGSSLVGAHKFFNAEVLVGYRVHGKNGWYGKRFSAVTKLKRELAVTRLFAHFRQAMGYDQSLCELAYLEFRTHPCPDFALTKKYLSLARSCRLSMMIKNYKKIVAHYLATLARRPGAKQHLVLEQGRPHL